MGHHTLSRESTTTDTHHHHTTQTKTWLRDKTYKTMVPSRVVISRGRFRVFEGFRTVLGLLFTRCWGDFSTITTQTQKTLVPSPPCHVRLGLPCLLTPACRDIADTRNPERSHATIHTWQSLRSRCVKWRVWPTVRLFAKFRAPAGNEVENNRHCVYHSQGWSETPSSAAIGEEFRSSCPAPA